MLSSLHIENYLLINNLDIELSPDLNIITGETGAGKSIILGAVQLLIGGKSDVSVLKNQSKNCIIEASFDIKEAPNSVKQIFEENDIDFEPIITIRRIITPLGKSKAYINDMPILLNVLKSVGEHLIDIHSQHQTLLLGDNNFQTEVLDAISSPKELIEDYNLHYIEYLNKKAIVTSLKESMQKAKHDQDYLRFQYDQLEDAKLVPNEKEDLEQEFKMLNNSQLVTETLLSCLSYLNDDENSILPILNRVNSSISKISEYIKGGDNLKERLHSVYIELKENHREIESLSESISNDPEKLNQISLRLDLINSLELKHKVNSVDELIVIREKYKKELSIIDNFDDVLASALNDMESVYKKAKLIASKISSNRKSHAKELENNVVTILNDLGIPNSKLIVDITDNETLSKTGLNTIQFLFSANKGIACEKIDKVASGGEMSRLMLSLKAIVSKHRYMPTLIFDEIDTGVSGKVADKMGEIIVKLSKNIQIINITHLAQIAAKGDTHLFVYKEHLKDESITNIKLLSQQERVEQIAMMISGSELTSSAILQAKELLK